MARSVERARWSCDRRPGALRLVGASADGDSGLPGAAHPDGRPARPGPLYRGNAGSWRGRHDHAARHPVRRVALGLLAAGGSARSAHRGGVVSDFQRAYAPGHGRPADVRTALPRCGLDPCRWRRRRVPGLRGPGGCKCLRASLDRRGDVLVRRGGQGIRPARGPSVGISAGGCAPRHADPHRRVCEVAAAARPAARRPSRSRADHRLPGAVPALRRGPRSRAGMASRLSGRLHACLAPSGLGRARVAAGALGSAAGHCPPRASGVSCRRLARDALQWPVVRPTTGAARRDRLDGRRGGSAGALLAHADAG